MPVDGDAADVELLQVEVEPRQVLRGLGGDDRESLEPVAGRVIREAQVVVLRVVAAVAFEREVRVADAGRARRELPETFTLVFLPWRGMRRRGRLRRDEAVG